MHSFFITIFTRKPEIYVITYESNPKTLSEICLELKSVQQIFSLPNISSPKLEGFHFSQKLKPKCKWPV